MCGYGKDYRKSGRAKYRQTYHSDCHVKRRKFFLAAYVVQYAFFTQYLAVRRVLYFQRNGNGQKRAKDHGATGDFQKRRLQGAASQSLPHLRADKGINQ